MALLLLLLGAQLVRVARLYSLNWDEAHHLYDGYNAWTTHDFRLNAEVPPLVKLVAAAPLLGMHLGPMPPQNQSQALNAFRGGRAFVVGNGLDRVLLPARLTCVVWALLLAWLVYCMTRRMFGDTAGLLALTLFVFDPLLLANGALVETDVASALFFFASVFAFYLYAEQPGAPRLLVLAATLGLAFAAKFTGIVLLPVLLLLCLAQALRRRSWAVLLQLAAACGAASVLGWAVLWGVYGFRYAAAPAGLALSPQLQPYVAAMPGGGATVLAWIARHRLLPEAFVWGLANTKYTEWEYTSYFFGRVYRHGPWQYFPAAFLIKSTLPLLLLTAAAPLLWRSPRREKAGTLPFLLLPVATYLAVVVQSHFDIGARHLLPVYPFLYVAAGGVVALAFRRGGAWVVAGIALIVWQVGASLWIAPDYMAYGNEAWGGPLHVRNYLSDANVDWGQQLKTVQRYLQVNHVQDCWFAYFPDGAVEPGDYGVHCRRLPTPSALWWMNLPMEVPPTITGTVLISESDLDGVESGDGPLNPYEAFRDRKPIAVLQHGVYVFRGTFPVPLAAAWVDVRRSGDLRKAGDTDGALRAAREAVGLAPRQARTQLNLAQMLAAGGKWTEAAAHYRQAAQWLQANRPELEQEELRPAIEAGLRETSAHLQAHSMPQ